MSTNENNFWDDSEQSLVDLFKKKHLLKKQNLLAMAQSLQLESCSSRRSPRCPPGPILTADILKENSVTNLPNSTQKAQIATQQHCKGKENHWSELPCKSEVSTLIPESKKQNQQTRVEGDITVQQVGNKRHRSQNQFQDYSYLEVSEAEAQSPNKDHSKSEVTELTLFVEDSVQKEQTEQRLPHPVSRTLDYSTDEGTMLDLSQSCTGLFQKKGKQHEDQTASEIVWDDSSFQEAKKASLELKKLHAKQKEKNNGLISDRESVFGQEDIPQMEAEGLTHFLNSPQAKDDSPSLSPGKSYIETFEEQDFVEAHLPSTARMTPPLREGLEKLWTGFQRSISIPENSATSKLCGLVALLLESRLVVLLGDEIYNHMNKDLFPGSKPSHELPPVNFLTQLLKDVVIVAREDPTRGEKLLLKARANPLITHKFHFSSLK